MLQSQLENLQKQQGDKGASSSQSASSITNVTTTESSSDANSHTNIQQSNLWFFSDVHNLVSKPEYKSEFAELKGQNSVRNRSDYNIVYQSCL